MRFVIVLLWFFFVWGKFGNLTNIKFNIGDFFISQKKYDVNFLKKIFWGLFNNGFDFYVTWVTQVIYW